MNNNGSTPRYRPVEEQIMRILSDGFRHYVHDVCRMIDPTWTKENLHPHIKSLRKILNPLGEDISWRQEESGTPYLMYVRITSTKSNG